jgi:hypothetical protein
MQTTLTAPAGASWLTAALCALFMLVQSVGCKPEFTDNTCKTDQDCFASEICGPAGACIIAPQVVTPTISSFAAAPTALVSGDTLTLSWSLRDATSATITSDQGFSYTIPAAGLAQGMTTLTPEQTATYTLTAVNGELSATRTVMVEVTQPELPAITSFMVDPMMVDAGGMVTLSWETANAVSGQITGGAQPYDIPANDLAAGTTRVAVSQPTTFTLTVNPAGMDDASASVGVNGQPPAITAFAATPSAVVAGAPVVLSWQTAGAASITITDAAANSLDLTGQAPGAGQITINPAASNTYTLTAVNPFGQAPRSVDVTVVPKLTINTFTAAPDSIMAGESITLTWALTGTPTSVEIRDAQGRSVPLGGAALSGGAVMAAPSQTTTYTITARDAQQEATATAAVTVIPLPPTITQFVTDQPRISAGGAANLSWRTLGATSIVLADAQGNMIDVTGENPSLDSIAVSPTQTTTYTLRALNAGGMASADVTVNVGGEVTINSFAASPQGALVGGSVTLAWDISNAATISIVGSDGTTLDVTGKAVTQDTISVTPALGMTTYTLTATGFAGPATATTTVTISSGVAITAFTASPNPVAVGQPTTLSWTTSGATALTLTATTAGGTTTAIDLTGKNVASDTIAVATTAATTYTLSATGTLNSMTSATVNVAVFTPADITSFTADDTTTISGEAVTLSWQTTGATGLTIVDQLGAQVTIPANADLASDSIVVRPQVTTTYTLLVTGAQSSDDMANVTITVTPAPLLITELLVDVTGVDDGQEWVELYNPGDTFVDLANYSLGHGGTNYLITRVQLAGVLPPRGCAVIGGPATVAANGSPTFFQGIAFMPALQNGGAASDGVALFATRSANITATSVPMDAILYSGTNTSNLLGEDGQPKTVISPLPPTNGSIERVSPTSDLFRAVAAPTPGRCVTVDQVQGTTRAPNEASGTLRFAGFAFDPMLMTAALGAQTLTCAATAPGVYECPLAAPGLTVTGAQDLTITQTHEYTADASGAAVRTPLATPLVTTRPAAFFWEGRLEDTNADLFCGHFQPGASTATAGQPISVFGEIYIAGVTNMGAGTLPAGYIVEGGYFARGQTPYLLFGQAWTAANQSSTFGGMFNSNVIYEAPFTSATAQQAEAALRFSPDGISYYYCDLSTQGGSDNGWTTDGGALIEWTP